MKDKIKKTCDICLYKGIFTQNHYSIREGFCCPKCGASLRYQEQFAMMKNAFDLSPSNNIKDFVKKITKNKLSLYEPGIIGPFRKYFNNIKTYKKSYYWNDVAIGEYKEGIQCQNLEDLTYDDSVFDLVITSDIFEHIRNPKKAFREIHRILKDGGVHIFTIPIRWPVKSETLQRVDVTGDNDVFLQPERYHGSPVDSKGSLVYNDFDLDIIDFLDEELGFVTRYSGISSNITFCSIKDSQ